MKKGTALLLSLCLLVLIGGCKQPQPAERQATKPAHTEEQTTKTPEERSGLSAEERQALIDNLPVMDGSTSMIPFEAGIRAALCGIPFDEAKSQVAHHKTWGAFQGLLEGTVDLLLTTPMSQAQRDNAKEANVGLTEIPVTKEGFVFVVNAKNPVESLSQQQLKDIYSGKITNWKELGGADAAIIPYQRNTDSGSQNFMIDFMQDSELMDAPVDLRPGEMGHLMDAIAVNDNAENAIGYSVYTYAADMYRDAASTKFIKVDGVAPSRAAMADGTYPLTANNYAVFRTDAAKDAPVRTLVDYMLSEEGQTAAADAGYVPVTGIEYDFTDTPGGSRYKGAGTGGNAPKTPSLYEIRLDHPYESNLPVRQHPDGTNTYYAEGIESDALRQDVNAFLLESVHELEAKEPEFLVYYEQLKKNTSEYEYERRVPEGQFVNATLTVRNAYLSVAVTLDFSDYYYGSVSACYDARTAVWDLRTGKRVQPEALFYTGTDINAVLTAWLNKTVHCDLYTFDGQAPEILGLPETGWRLTATDLYFTKENPYFENGAVFPLTSLPAGTMTAEDFYDPSAEVDAELYGFAPLLAETDQNVSYGLTDDDVAFAALDEEKYPAAKKINETVLQYMETYYSEDTVEETAAGRNVDSEFGGRMAIYASEIRGRYYYVHTPACHLISQEGDDWRYELYPYCRTFFFDLRTGDEVSWTVLLKDGWEKKISDVSCTANLMDGGEVPAPPTDQLKTMDFVSVWCYENKVSLVLRAAEPDELDCTVILPYDALNLQ